MDITTSFFFLRFPGPVFYRSTGFAVDLSYSFCHKQHLRSHTTCTKSACCTFASPNLILITGVISATREAHHLSKSMNRYSSAMHALTASWELFFSCHLGQKLAVSLLFLSVSRASISLSDAETRGRSSKINSMPRIVDMLLDAPSLCGTSTYSRYDAQCVVAYLMGIA